MALSFRTGEEKAGFGLPTFLFAMQESGLTEAQAEAIVARLCSAAPAWKRLIDASFLPAPMKTAYLKLLDNRLERLLCPKTIPTPR